jgi:hypothetical protein
MGYIPHDTKNHRLFQIIQYSMHRSKDVARATFLRDPKALEAGIIAAQEPWDNPFEDTTHHPTKRSHQLLYPHEADTGKGTRVCCLIHRRFKTASWHHEAYTRDNQTIRLRHYRVRDLQTLALHNMYNQEGTDTLRQLST